MEKSTYTIERFDGDIEELWPFVKLSASLDRKEAAKKLLRIEKAKGTVYFVAKFGDELVGAIGVYVDSDSEIRLLEPAQVIDIAVLKSHRRKGIARALMTRAEEFAAEHGEESLWLFTDGNAPDLVAFYRELGYVLAGVVTDYWGPGSAKATFHKDIS